MLTMTRLTKQTKVLDALLPGNAKDRDKKNDSYTSLGGNLNLNDTEKGLGKLKYIPDLWWQLGLKPSLCSKSSLGLTYQDNIVLPSHGDNCLPSIFLPEQNQNLQKYLFSDFISVSQTEIQFRIPYLFTLLG